MRSRFYIQFLLPLAALLSCKVDPRLSERTVPVEKKPAGWPEPVYTFSTNTLTEEKFQLGRALFYDPILSRDNTISCASCHQLSSAFAHGDHDLSHGVDGRFGNRNSPALFNLTWHPYFMHDGGINHIEVQPLGPIANVVEMDEKILNVLEKLKASNRYRVMFKNAYSSDEIDTQRFLLALTQFMGMLYSMDSKYDKVKKGEKGVSFTEQEQKGYSLFLSNCNSCHKEPLFSDFAFRNNGLPVNAALKDSGRAHITRQAQDLHRYKTPSLRNIELTSPYMHNGTLNTLEQCLDNYTSNTRNLVNIDPLLANPLSLSAEDKAAIIAFLKTLTDRTFVNNTRFGDPKNNL